MARLSGCIFLDTRPLVEELELEIDAGWTCLLGPSGSGKTTLLRILAGLPCQASHKGLREVPERVGWMAQSDTLQPRLSVLDNVRLMHCLRGTRLSDTEAESLLHQVGLGEKIQSMPDELSGGQRQRVALARVLADGAPLVLLDEPFSALDPITRVAMQDLTYRCLEGCAVIMVSHDPSEALRLSDRIHVLSNRKLVEEHPLLECKPCSVDDPSLNIASGKLLSRLAGFA